MRFSHCHRKFQSPSVLFGYFLSGRSQQPERPLSVGYRSVILLKQEQVCGNRIPKPGRTSFNSSRLPMGTGVAAQIPFAFAPPLRWLPQTAGENPVPFVASCRLNAEANTGQFLQARFQFTFYLTPYGILLKGNTTVSSQLLEFLQLYVHAILFVIAIRWLHYFSSIEFYSRISKNA